VAGADYFFDARFLAERFFVAFLAERFFVAFLARFAPLRADFLAPFFAAFLAPRFVAFLADRFFVAFLADFFAPVFLALRFFADLRVFFAGGEELGAIMDIMSAIIV
jgi:hypothetical protein